MSPYYFLGKWIVELSGIGQLAKMAEDFEKTGCEVRELAAEANPDDLLVLPLVISIPSKDMLQELNTKTYNVEIKAWAEVSKEVFLNGYQIKADPYPRYIAWLNGLAGLALKNEYTLNKEVLEAGRHYDVPINVLGLNERLVRLLARTAITTVGDALDVLGRGREVMLQIWGMNENMLDELISKLREHGYL